MPAGFPLFTLLYAIPGLHQIADRAYVLAGGRTVLEAPAAELAGDQRLVRAYLGAAP